MLKLKVAVSFLGWNETSIYAMNKQKTEKELVPIGTIFLLVAVVDG